MRILLGISGGIAAYKTPEIVRQLGKAGHEVRCVATDSALEMVSARALHILSEHPVLHQLWPQGDANTIPHIEAVRWCERMVIAPATANIMAKCASGIADDLLSTMYLAIEPDKPISFAPAMNTVMWEKPTVQANLETLIAHGCQIIDPVSGNLACGEEGTGAMASPEDIVDKVVR